MSREGEVMIPDKRAAAMYALYREGKSVSEIGVIYSLSRQQVSAILKRAGYVLTGEKKKKEEKGT